MATSVTIPVDEVPLFVPDDITNQTAPRMRVGSRVLSGGHGAGVLNQNDFLPTIVGNEVLVTKGSALIPTDGFDGSSDASAPETGYYAVTMGSNITGSANLAPASDGTWLLCLSVDESTLEQAVVEIVGSAPSYPHIQLATLNRASGTTTLVSDDRYFSGERTPQAYNSIIAGKAGSSALGSPAWSTMTGLSGFAASHDPAGMAVSLGSGSASTSYIAPLLDGIYAVQFGMSATVSAAHIMTLALNKESTTATTNVLGRAGIGYGTGLGTSYLYNGTTWSGLIELTAGEKLRLWTYNTNSGDLAYNVHFSMFMVSPRPTLTTTGMLIG